MGVEVCGLPGRYGGNFNQCRGYSMALDAVEGIFAIKREDGTSFLEPNSGRKCHDLYLARDCHAALAPGLEVDRQLLLFLAGEYGAKGPSHNITAGDRLRFHS